MSIRFLIVVPHRSIYITTRALRPRCYAQISQAAKAAQGNAAVCRSTDDMLDARQRLDLTSWQYNIVYHYNVHAYNLNIDQLTNWSVDIGIFQASVQSGERNVTVVKNLAELHAVLRLLPFRVKRPIGRVPTA